MEKILNWIWLRIIQMINIVSITEEIFLQQFLRWQPLYVGLNHIIILVKSLTRTYLIFYSNDSSMQSKIFVRKKKTLFNKPKLACVEIKDNSISLLEFVFDLNFDENIFPKNPIKIVQNKDTYLTSL